MTSRHVLAWCGSLGVLVVVAAGVEGGAHFSGPRWVPHFHSGPVAVPTFSAPAAPLATKAPLVSHSAAHFPIGTILLWTAVSVAVVLAILLFLWWRRRAPRRRASRPIAVPTPPPVADVARAAEPAPDVPVIRSGIEEALLDLERDGEPGDAVVRAWLGLQQTAEQSGVARGPSETPTEFTSRIMSRVLGGNRDDRADRDRSDDRDAGDAITTLLRLYLRTRFGDHPVTTADVALVQQALRELVRTWDPADVPGRGASGRGMSGGAEPAGRGRPPSRGSG